MIRIKAAITVLAILAVGTAMSQPVHRLDNIRVVTTRIYANGDIAIRRLAGEPGKVYRLTIASLIIAPKFRQQALARMRRLVNWTGRCVITTVDSSHLHGYYYPEEQDPRLPVLPWTIIDLGYGYPPPNANPNVMPFLESAKAAKRGMWATPKNKAK
jgi:hypothetical protein